MGNSEHDSSYYLLMRSSHGEKKFLLQDQPSWTIGRGRENDIPLADKCASRNHAMIQVMGHASYFLIDLGSRNGSFLNGRRVTVPMGLKNGDQITLGESQLDFFCPASLAEDDSLAEENTDTDTVMLHKRRLITVLVLDIREFTKLTQMLNEGILSEMIGTWFRRAGEIITRYGSWVDKYIGDAVMAVWIHSSASTASDLIPTHEMLRVYRALYDLSQMTDELNALFKLPFRLRVGAGVNTGYAIVGQLGTHDRPDYTALGDTVNAAFRLESVTKQLDCEVAIGAATYGQTPYASVLLPFQQHTVNLKGYDDPAVIYFGQFRDVALFLSKIHLPPVAAEERPPHLAIGE
ncbi:MAG: adenylate/guanylate cyclase domain-containing protein [Oscillatoriales cyanobacterium SM2_2_1]|nr:adenylate/guanylate cyclase domain-containing protein [Oscillatoriales cyanobacterium SM2_2_1]